MQVHRSEDEYIETEQRVYYYQNSHKCEDRLKENLNEWNWKEPERLRNVDCWL